VVRNWCPELLVKTLSGLAGAISSLAPTLSSLSPPLLASTSLDRFFRLHSTYDPRNALTDGSNRKGEVLAKVWVKSAASCVAWDGKVPAPRDVLDEEDEHEHDIWAELQDVGEENDTSLSVINSTSKGSDGEEGELNRSTNKKKKIR
jgi:ribosome biogenesis protein NSA1